MTGEEDRHQLVSNLHIGQSWPAVGVAGVHEQRHQIAAWASTTPANQVIGERIDVGNGPPPQPVATRREPDRNREGAAQHHVQRRGKRVDRGYHPLGVPVLVQAEQGVAHDAQGQVLHLTEQIHSGPVRPRLKPGLRQVDHRLGLRGDARSVHDRLDEPPVAAVVGRLEGHQPTTQVPAE